MNEEEPVKSRAIAIGFVTYHPGASFIPRLEMLVDRGLDVYVFDNSPEEGAVREFCATRPGSRYSTHGENAGLGVGLSAVCSRAHQDSHPALLFFDQDTVFGGETLDFIERFYEGNQALASSYSAIVFDAKDVGRGGAADAPVLKDVLLAISSGSLFFLENLRRMNWHNPSYFVDCVDYEFCLNSSNHGLKIGLCSTTPGFDHQSEQPDQRFLILGREWYIRRYPARRILDTLTASARLMGTSIVTGNLRFLGAIVRSVGIYGAFQVLVRLLGPAGSGKRNET
jgi:rhamnosyltransferase